MQEILSKEKVGSRIRELRLQSALSQDVVSNSLGLSRSNYSQIELGNQYPTYEILVKLAIIYNKSYEWILHGWKLNEEGAGEAVPEKLVGLVPGAVHAERGGDIQLVKNSDQYTYLALKDEPHYINELSTVKIPGFQNSPENIHRAFEVRDSGMRGLLHQGDIVTGRNIRDLTELVLNDVYVVITCEDVIIRRISKYIQDKNIILCKADNYHFPVSIIKVDEIAEMWHIRGIFSTKLTTIVEEMEQRLSVFEKSIFTLKKEVEGIKI